MSEKIVNLTEEREKRTPHLTGRARCLACGHRWEAVAPVGTIWLTCPLSACGLERGRFVAQAEVMGVEHWHCACGCDLFYITKDYIYCPNCGEHLESRHGD